MATPERNTFQMQGNNLKTLFYPPSNRVMSGPKPGPGQKLDKNNLGDPFQFYLSTEVASRVESILIEGIHESSKPVIQNINE